MLCAFMAATAGAQPTTKTPRIGVLSPVNPRTEPQFVAFEQRLRELGWTDGGSVTIDFRRPENLEELPANAADLVRSGVSVIVATGPEPPLKASRQATTTVPIVMIAINYDPVERGYIAGLPRPGGNITGVFYPQLDLGAKQLELLREAVPKATSLAVLWDARFSADQLPAIEAAGKLLKIELQKVEVAPPYDLETAFTRVKAGRASGVLVAGSPVFFRERARISELALKHRLPSMGAGGLAESGTLLGYSPSLDGLFRRAADYVDKILRGAAPANLPVEQPSTVDLTINLKTARALGLALPPALLQRANRVIE